MCGRITQYRQAQEYMQALNFPALLSKDAAERGPSYNTPPGSMPLVRVDREGWPQTTLVTGLAAATHG